ESALQILFQKFFEGWIVEGAGFQVRRRLRRQNGPRLITHTTRQQDERDDSPFLIQAGELNMAASIQEIFGDDILIQRTSKAIHACQSATRKFGYVVAGG